jgi:hypothetical protein
VYLILKLFSVVSNDVCCTLLEKECVFVTMVGIHEQFIFQSSGELLPTWKLEMQTKGMDFTVIVWFFKFIYHHYHCLGSP